MVYLDHAATTPMLPEALAAYAQATGESANASSLHSAGRRARRLVEESRELIAQRLDARPSEVIFTGGGTESDNLAVKGIFWARRDEDPRRNVILASAIEHHAVLDAVTWLAEHEGAKVVWLEVDRDGFVTPEVFHAALQRYTDQVALATVMWANNEVGTVAPIAQLASLAAQALVPFHTDAVQAVGQIPVSFQGSGASALTMTGHKIGGPYGVGVLLLGRQVRCMPLLHGGGQERSVRSGTLDVAGIAALAVAVDTAVSQQTQTAKRMSVLRDDLITRLRIEVPDIVVNGPDPFQVAEQRLPGNAHISFPGCEGDTLLMLLDGQGIESSTGSACTAGVAQPSHVLLAMGSDVVHANSSLRFSLGHTSTEADIDAFIAAIGSVVERARRASAAAAQLR